MENSGRIHHKRGNPKEVIASTWLHDLYDSQTGGKTKWKMQQVAQAAEQTTWQAIKEAQAVHVGIKGR